MVEIAISYEGKLRCKATHEPSNVQLITDAPKDNMGEGASFSPTDLVATALGSCMLTLMGITAQRLELDLSGSTVRVSKEMVASPVRRIGKLTVDIYVPKPLTDDEKQKLESAAKTCPVHRSLHPDVETPINFHWAS